MSQDDKVLQLMEKMYIELQETKANMATIEYINELKRDIQQIKQTMATRQDIETLLVEQQKDIMSMLKVTHNQIDEKLDAISNELTDIKEAVGNVELITASNWRDITKLKSIK